MQLLFFDLETMGLSPQYCSILEIAAIVVDTDSGAGWETVNYFHQYIRPFSRIPYNITQINGITNEMVENCSDEKTVLKEFATWLTGNGYNTLPAYAHNGKFDFGFLVGRSSLYSSSIEEIFVDMRTRLKDTLPMARTLVKSGFLKTEGGKAKQELVAKALGIQYHAHSALEDAKALVLIVKKLNELGGININD